MVRRESNQEGQGLVSSRVELYETTQNHTKVAYRTSDSFTAPNYPSLEQRNGDGEDTIYIGSALIESGIQHYAQGEYEKALKAFHAALNTQRVSLGTDHHHSIARTHFCIGSIYLRQGKLVHAKKELEHVLAIYAKLNKDTPNDAQDVVVANTLNNLGTVASSAGDYGASFNYYLKALHELRQKDGPKRDIADVLYNLGRMQFQMRDFDTAMLNLKESCRISREIHTGRARLFLAQILNLTGIVHVSTNAFDAAMDSFLEANEIIVELRGDAHEDLASSWYHIGLVKEAKELPKDAWDSFTKSRDIYTRLGVDQDNHGLKHVRRSIARVEQIISQSKSKAYDF